MNETAVSVRKGLDANTLKLIAIVCMLIDHIAWAFVPTASVLGQVMHILGRLTAPIMCFFIAEGYYHTRNVKRYALRLGIFALVSYLPFIFFETGALPNGNTFLIFNVIYTLFLGLLALWAWDRISSVFLRIVVVVAICVLATFGDWSFYGILMILAFGLNRGRFKRLAIWIPAIALLMVGTMLLPYFIYMGDSELAALLPPFWEYFANVGIQLAVVLSLPLLYFYNGKRGGGIGGKWLFYIFYPAHLVLIGVIKLIVQ